MLDFAIKQNGSKKSLFEKKIPHLEAKKNASADNLKKKKSNEGKANKIFRGEWKWKPCMSKLNS